MDRQEHLRKMNKIIARAWVDDDFKARLKADPAGVLKHAGLHTSDHVRVYEDTPETCHFVIPMRPSTLSDEDLTRDDPHPDICSTICLLCT